MPDRPPFHLRDYDYASPGAYFITLCTHQRRHLLGAVADGVVRPNAAGRMVEHWWAELAHRFPTTGPELCVVMPNHFHGLLWLAVDESSAGNPSLETVVRWLKTMTTNAYIRGVRAEGWPPFEKRLWQPDFYEHVVRSEQALERIREYIVANPLRWEGDDARSNPIAL